MDLEIDFKFEREFLKSIKRKGFSCPPPFNEVRGVALYPKTILINLSAQQWKIDLLFGEDNFINELTKTDTHEVIHLIIGEQFKTYIPKKGEESICQVLSGQILGMRS